MPRARTAAQVIKAIGCENLSLYRGEGYWYFEYDDGDQRFETRSVMVPYLSHMELSSWIAEGRELVKEMEEGDET
ncbi:hypothetical protein RPALISO_218 [Ruegeria phage RpAliso]|nr:hypothetical protein RPALISO_218 [Ruegeria phage RpAliso]